MSVVHDGRPLLVRGFGSARLGRENSDEVDEPVPVTENTKFAIASLSKAFTATLTGILLKEQETRSVSHPNCRLVTALKQHTTHSVTFVNENENENGVKRENNKFVNKK